MLEISLFVVLGMISGVLAGLLGIGGGVLVVPGLVFIFNYLKLPAPAIMHMATSTSLATIIFTTFIAVIAQQRRRAIHWDTVLIFAPGILAGAWVGTLIANALSGSVLRILFGIFLLVVAVHLFFKHQVKSSNEEEKSLNKRWLQVVAGFIAGVFGGTLGVGGGILIVPMLLHMGFKVHHAMATSSACILLLSIAGTLSASFIDAHALGGHGYIYWPAVFWLALASMCFVPLGTKLAYYLSPHVLQRVFAVFLLLLSIDMLVKV